MELLLTWISPKMNSLHPLGTVLMSLVAQMVKNLPAMQETWVRKIPWRRTWLPTPVFLPGEPPWTEETGGLQSIGHKESGSTE